MIIVPPKWAMGWSVDRPRPVRSWRSSGNASVDFASGMLCPSHQGKESENESLNESILLSPSHALILTQNIRIRILLKICIEIFVGVRRRILPKKILKIHLCSKVRIKIPYEQERTPHVSWSVGGMGGCWASPFSFKIFRSKPQPKAQLGS